MIDTELFKEKLEARWLGNGFTKLDTPELDARDVYIACNPTPSQYKEFDFLVWEPAMLALEKDMLLVEIQKFYKVDVYYTSDNVLVISSSRGESERFGQSA